MQPSIPLGETFQKIQPLISHDWIFLSHCFCHPLLGLKSVSTHHEIPPNINPTPMWPEVSWRAGRGYMTFCTADSPQIHAPSAPLPETEPTLSPFLSLSTALSLSAKLALAISCFIYQNPASLSIQISSREASQRVLCKTKAQSLAKQLN